MENCTTSSSTHGMPCSSLMIEDQRMGLPLTHRYATVSSPLLDMEAALQQLNNSCELLDTAANSASRPSTEDPDVLMGYPFLDYINEVLMEEGMEAEDGTCMQHDAPYLAILSGFYEIIGEQNRQTNRAVNRSASPPLPHQIFSSYDTGPDEQGTAEAGSVQSGLVQESHVVTDDTPLGTAASSPIDILDISFEDLKLNADYESLYVGEPRSLDSSKSAAHGSAVARKGSRRSGNKGTAEVQGFVDLRELLMSCAQAVSIGDVRRANEILQDLHQVHGASASGSGLQRTAYYFSKALAARMRGIGDHQFRAISLPPPAMFLRAIKLASYKVSPYTVLTHYFAHQSILKAAEGASRLHIVDYGLSFGLQWPCLMNALADREGGPPMLVITGIEFPDAGHNPAETLEASGLRLAAYARTYSVPFQYHAIPASKWEEVDATSLHLREDEVLVVSCVKRLRHLSDESVDMAWTASPRQKLLTSMHSLNPHLLVFSDLNAAYNSAFFVSRFREALHFYSNLFDMMDTLWGDDHLRLMIEGCYHYRQILNIVACEGVEKEERPETYKQWEVRINRAGFKQVPIPTTIVSRATSHLKKHYHKDFHVHDDANGWILMGWKGRTLVSFSVWRPSHV